MNRTLFPLLLVLLSASAPAGGAEPFARAAALNQAMADETFKQITSVLVSVGGDLKYEAYWGEGSAELMNDTRSATKTLVALGIGAAIDDGHIADVDAKAWGWFESLAPFRHPSDMKANITVADLLTMSSALDCNDNVWESPGNEEHMYPARTWTVFVVDLPVQADYARDQRGRGPFAYCTAGSFLLGQIIQRAVDEPVDQYLQRRILSPLGIARANWDRSPVGEVMTGGGTEITSKGLLALGELILNRGKHDGKPVISAGWIDAMLTRHRQARPGTHYGYQIWEDQYQCGKREVSGWYMGGNGGNKVAVFPELEMVAVVTATLYGTRGMHQQSADILSQYVLPSLADCQL